MKINQFFLTISTFLVTLPMHADAMDKKPENNGIPRIIRTGFALKKTPGEMHREVIQEMNAIPREELDNRINHYHYSAICEELEAAERYVPQEIRQFVPPELLAEIGFSTINSPLDVGQKQYRLGLKLIDYSNLLYGYILSKIDENRDFIVTHRDTNAGKIQEMISQLKFSETDLAPIPQGVQRLMYQFIYLPDPTPSHLDFMLKYYKNKYVATQFLTSSDAIYQVAQGLPDENKTDILFSVALGYKWVGDRLGANYAMAHPNDNSEQEPHHYQYYRKALQVHEEAKSKARFAHAEFKKKYLQAILYDFYGKPQTQSCTFIANPLKVIPKMAVVGSHS